MATALFALATLLVIAPRDRPGLHLEHMQAVAKVGAPVTASGLFAFATQNIDYAILAARLPAVQLGYYVRAFQLGVDYQGKVSGVMLRIALPVFARTEDLAHLRRVRGRMVRVHAVVIFPLLFLLLVLAPVIIPWLFGSNWEQAVAPTQILVGAGMVACIGTGTGPLMVALGRTGTLLVYNVCAFVAYVAAVAISASHGLTVVCITVVATKVLSLVVLLYVVQRLIGLGIVETLRNDVVPALAGGAGIAAVGFPLVHLLDEVSCPAPVIAIVVGAVGLAVYAGVLARCSGTRSVT